MTTPSEEEARALTELINEIEGRIRHEPGCNECDMFRRTAAALASRVSTPPSEAPAWMDKHGDVWIFPGGGDTGWSFETQPFSRAHIEKKWGPLIPLVPAVPVLPGEPVERFVSFTITDWRGSWGELQTAVDQFAAGHGVTLESIHMSGGDPVPVLPTNPRRGHDRVR